jgi:hypothetical protein
MVFENDYLLQRDKADFAELFDNYGFTEKIDYRVGINFQPGANELVIVDEADCFIFE